MDIRRKNDNPYILNCDKVYCVNGTKASTLHLIRGHKYMFNILQDSTLNGKYEYELYFTSSPVGGTLNSSVIPNTKSQNVGPLLLDVTPELPEYFYYQDKYHRHMGGLIIIHNKKEYKKLQKKRKNKK